MSLESDVRYLIDRHEIEDKIKLYALGQDNHQPGADVIMVLKRALRRGSVGQRVSAAIRAGKAVERRKP